MSFRNTSIALILAAALNAGAASAATLHDNAGALLTTMNTWFNSTAGGPGWSVADQFVIDAPSTVTGFDFSYTNEVAIGSADIAIYDLAFSALLDRTTVFLTNIDTGLNSSRASTVTHSIFTATVSGLSQQLNAGTYWFAYQLNETDGDLPARVAGGINDADATDDSHLQNRNDFSAWPGDTRFNPEALDFTVYGNVGGTAPVPLPAAGWLMLAGLGGFATLRRRKKAT